MNQKFFLLFLFVLCPLLGSEPATYQLSIESVTQGKEKGKKAQFLLNNKYEFLGDYHKKQVTKLTKGTPVDISAHSFHESVYRLWAKAPGEDWTYYEVSISPETLKKLPKITDTKENKGWRINNPTWEVTLDDGSKWEAIPENFALYSEHWKVGNQVIVSKMEGDVYRLVNINAPHKLEKENKYIETRSYRFKKRVD